MTELQLFAFFLMPLAIVALAGLVFLIEGRRLRPKGRSELFDKKSLHTPGE